VIVVDAHLHVWDPRDAEYSWLSAADPLHRRIDLDDVADDVRAARVDAVVLVQAADSAADTAHMIAVADRHPSVAGIVAWVPLDDVVDAERALGRADRRIVGVRNLTHDRPDPEWLLRPEVAETVAMLAERRIPLDVVTNDPSGLRVIATLAERHPMLQIVVDHLGKPRADAALAARAQWKALLGACATHPGVVAKLSGFGPPETGIRPIVDDAVELFGPRRLMAGSDWPLSTGAGYAQTWSTLRAALAGLDDVETAEVLGGTAVRVYGLQAAVAGSEPIR
jgi:L-fuconolactonase